MVNFAQNFDSINLLAVFVATLASNLLGGVWYAPFLFGKPWKKAIGITDDTPLNNPAATFTAGFTLQLITASLLAALLGPTGTALEGLRLGVLVGVAFVFTAIGITNLFERRPIPLILINSGFHIVSLGIMGLIIGTWR